MYGEKMRERWGKIWFKGTNCLSPPFTFIGAMSCEIKLSLLSPKCMMTERLSEAVLKKGQPLSDWWRVRWLCHWSPVHSTPAPPAKGLSGIEQAFHTGAGDRKEKQRELVVRGEPPTVTYWQLLLLLRLRLYGRRIALEEKAVDISTRLKL